MSDKPYEHINFIEFTEEFYGIELNCVALFNDTVIDEESVLKYLNQGISELPNSVLILTKYQYDALCGKIKGE